MGSFQKFYADAAVERARQKRLDHAELERQAAQSSGGWMDDVETEFWAKLNTERRKRG